MDPNDTGYLRKSTCHRVGGVSVDPRVEVGGAVGVTVDPRVVVGVEWVFLWIQV